MPHYFVVTILNWHHAPNSFAAFGFLQETIYLRFISLNMLYLGMHGVDVYILEKNVIYICNVDLTSQMSLFMQLKPFTLI